MDLRKLIERIEFSKAIRCNGLEISHITDYADKVKPGSLFIAIEGKENDGHDFVNQAIQNGASAIVISDSKKELFKKFDFYKGGIITTSNTRKFLVKALANFYNTFPTLYPLQVFGVTGTNGKTTTCFLLDRILSSHGKKIGKFTTTEFDTGKTKGDSIMTTPDVFTLQAGLKDMRDSGYDIALVEISSHGIDQFRIDPGQVYVAILTNISQDHLDYHRNMDEYIRTKCRLFEHLDRNSFAILNRDDELFDRFKDSTSAKVISYGINKKADFTAYDIKSDIDGSVFKLIYPGGKVSINTSLIGTHNIYNILAAMAATYVIDISPKEITSVIENFQTVCGRLQEIHHNNGFRVFIDYAHTPDALEKVLNSLKPNCEGRLILVFGCGGDRDKGKRPQMGKIASLYSDFFVITNDNPRNEKPEKIIYDIKQGIPCLPTGKPCLSAGRPSNNGNFDIILDRTEAIHKAIKEANRGDIVIIAGKGHEKYQIIGDTRVYFDDVEVAREALT